jgi:prepilin signal peptidase PulO-like enzyme (type II secretory pathway)
MVLVLVVISGVLVGAVVNRLGTDLPARRAPRRPRCPYCGQNRPWHQWLSLPSYVINQTRCPDCSAPIPIRYPLVELALGFLFGYLYLRHGLSARFAFYAAYTAIFGLIAVTDMERRLILNVVSFPGMGLALLGALVMRDPSWKSALVGGLTGYITFLVLAVVGNALFGPGALGGGDVKLAALIGVIVGFPLIIEALVLGVLCGGVISAVLLITRVRSMRDPIPYGPFLIVGGWVTMLWGTEIAYWFLYT